MMMFGASLDIFYKWCFPQV